MTLFLMPVRFVAQVSLESLHTETRRREYANDSPANLLYSDQARCEYASKIIQWLKFGVFHLHLHLTLILTMWVRSIRRGAGEADVLNSFLTLLLTFIIQKD